MSQFYGLDRPSALASDSPFAIADKAFHDKSSPSAPRMHTPTPRQKRQPSPLPPAAQPRYPQTSHATQGQGQGQGGYQNAMRQTGGNPYMGAGAYDSVNGRYGSQSPAPYHPPPSAQLPSHNGGYPQHLPPPSQQPYPYPHPPPQSSQYSPGLGPGRGGSLPPPPSAPVYSQPVQNPPISRPLGGSSPYYPSAPPPTSRPPPLQQQPVPSNRPYVVQERPSASSSNSSAPHISPYPPPPPPPPMNSHSPAPPSHSPSSASPAHYGTPPYVQQAQASNTRPDSRASTNTANSRGSIQDDELWRMFSAMDMDRSGTLSAKEVQALLAKDSRWRIEPREDCVKMLMNIFDTDRSGNINFVEFEGLYRYIKDWHAIFHRFDKDRSGTIDRQELEQALQSFGYPLPIDLVRKLEKRYAPPKSSDSGGPRGITFDRFLMACVTVKHFTEAFRKRDIKNEGRLTLDYSSFMELVLDAP